MNGRFCQNWLALNSYGCAHYKNDTQKMLRNVEKKYFFYFQKKKKTLGSPLLCAFPFMLHFFSYHSGATPDFVLLFKLQVHFY